MHKVAILLGESVCDTKGNLHGETMENARY